MTDSPTTSSILPPLVAPAPPVVPSAAERNTTEVNDAAYAFRVGKLAFLARAFSLIWGTPKPIRQPDGTLKPDPSQRYNKNMLTPAQAFAAEGTGAAANLEAFLVEVFASFQIDPTSVIHPETKEDMTKAPAGWTPTPNPDGTVSVAYAAPVPVTPPVTPAAAS